MTDGHPITVLTVDDHPLIRAGLRAVLGPEPDMTVVGEASNGHEAVALYREHRADVVLMDLRMPVMDGVEATRTIIAEFPDAKIIALTTYEGDEDIYRALSAGAKGYVIKDMLRTELLRVMRQVHGGQRGIPGPVATRLAEYTPRLELTPREMDVLRLMAKGLSNKEIAAIIGREESTVKVHVKNLMMKLDVDDRTAVVVVAIQRGFLHVE
ncbi:MAG TPA: response regulator transcription factor [Gemmatimonadaceae bacterium]|nr:response regulator transcription factor [Gemmatimonadaceae bacterium]